MQATDDANAAASARRAAFLRVRYCKGCAQREGWPYEEHKPGKGGVGFHGCSVCGNTDFAVKPHVRHRGFCRMGPDANAITPATQHAYYAEMLEVELGEIEERYVAAVNAYCSAVGDLAARTARYAKVTELFSGLATDYARTLLATDVAALENRLAAAKKEMVRLWNLASYLAARLHEHYDASGSTVSAVVP